MLNQGATVEVCELVVSDVIEPDERTRQALVAYRLGLVKVGQELVSAYRNRVRILMCPMSDAELFRWGKYYSRYWTRHEFRFCDCDLIPLRVLEAYEKALSCCAFDGFAVYNAHYPAEEGMLLGIRGEQYYKIARWIVEPKALFKSRDSNN